MPKTRIISPGIPNHKLLKNLQLDDNYISNDGGDEGISISDSGVVSMPQGMILGTNSGSADVFITAAYATDKTVLRAYYNNVLIPSTSAGGIDWYWESQMFMKGAADPPLIIHQTNNNYTGGKLRLSGQENGYYGQINGKLEFAKSKAEDEIAAYIYSRTDASDGTVGADHGGAGTNNDGDWPSNLVFSTTANGATTPTDRMTIGSDGVVTIVNDLSLTDGTSQIFDFDTANCHLRIFDDADTDGDRDYFDISVGAAGATSITTNDDGAAAATLTFDPDGKTIFKIDDGNADDIQILRDSTISHSFYSEHGAQNLFKIYEPDSTDDHFAIDVQADASTTILTFDNNAAGGHLTLDPDGEVRLTPVTEVRSDAPLKIKEAGSAVANTAAYGQLWVKTATPNQLYFTTDAGDNIQITSGTSIAAQASLTFGIADTNAVKIDGGSVADDEYARFTANGLESRSNAEVLSDIGAQATVTAGTNCTFSGATLNVDDAFVKNDADDTMTGTLTIDKNTTVTGTSTLNGLYIDWDQTGLVTGGLVQHRALKIDVNSDAESHSGGVVNDFGIDIDMTGNDGSGGGTTNQTGIEMQLAGAESATHLMMRHTNTSDWASISVGEDGATTFQTNDAGGVEADLTFEINGKMDIKQTDSQSLGIWNNNQKFASLGASASSSNLILYENEGATANDYFFIATYAAGNTLIGTWDGAADGGNITFMVDGRVEFDNCAVGFDRISYNDAADVTVNFKGGNKAHLDLTGGSITGTLTLQFPTCSGNFVLVIQQDSSTRTVNAWATKDAAGNAGNNDGGTAGAIRWAGGSAPDLTDGGNKRDVISFYWDADEEVCYGEASLNF